MQHARPHDISRVFAVSRNKPAILANAPLGGNIFELLHGRVPQAGILEPARRSAASSIASTICPYPVQRQMFDEIACTISSRVGFGLCWRSACADSTMAGVQ